ncbi:hypothetical protein B4U79_11788 [Dinothrombium tinctorium]|uniref:Choline/carnitine acyltransferase domain-containing protein n=1 Tax=Dinothrombium tinctorium TaxID=1965070 RepID=A0A3S3NJY8_9ACAR|nr:hypothetical protein B4U79_11788 [Dinothrombium tinctorium]
MLLTKAPLKCNFTANFLRCFVPSVNAAFVSIRAKSTLRGKDYQYLHISKLKTQHFQKSLPSLPIPELPKTCQRYLAAAEPVVRDKQQLENTRKIVKEFEKGTGAELHNELLAINKRNRHTSYISEPWFDMYLKSRLPVVLNYNPFMSFKDDPQPEYNIQSVRASNYLISALRFRRSLLDNVLAPEVYHLNPAKSDNDFYRRLMRLTPTAFAFYASALFKAFPLDMSQYTNLFSSTRIPRLGKDELLRFPESRHVAVIKRGQIFTFNVLDSRGNIKDPDYIHTCMKYLCKLEVDPNADSITFLSSEDRDQWAKVRERLIENMQNGESLRLLDSALMVICLDDVEFDTDMMKHAHNYLHGNNGLNTPLNRWFDKSFSLIFTKDGHCAINFEHSWGDGVAVLRFSTEVHKDVLKNHFVSSKKLQDPDIDPSKEVRKAEFKLDDFCKNAVKEAESKFRKNTENLRLNFHMSENMSREYFKKKKVSLDSIFQLAFQMSFIKLHNYTPVTYESCSTAAFKHGRTETVRPATMETNAAVAAFAQRDKYSASELRKMLDDCSKKHFQLTKDAAMGQGFDRHLFAMKTLAEKRGLKLPELYTDKTYDEMTHYVLSTSTLHGDCFSGGGFAPVVPDGYGIGYGSMDNILGIVCSSYAPHRDSKQFAEAFGESFNQIYRLLEKF